MDGRFRHQAHCPFRAGDSSTRVGVGLRSAATKFQNTRAPRALVSQRAGEANVSFSIFKDADVCVAQRPLISDRPPRPERKAQLKMLAERWGACTLCITAR
jgi:hypothetical protein